MGKAHSRELIHVLPLALLLMRRHLCFLAEALSTVDFVAPDDRESGLPHLWKGAEQGRFQMVGRPRAKHISPSHALAGGVLRVWAPLYSGLQSPWRSCIQWFQDSAHEWLHLETVYGNQAISGLLHASSLKFHFLHCRNYLFIMTNIDFYSRISCSDHGLCFV